jgi:hypothetical protein
MYRRRHLPDGKNCRSQVSLSPQEEPVTTLTFLNLYHSLLSTNLVHYRTNLHRNFVSKWVLKAHHLTHERMSASNFQFSECNSCFTTQGTLNRHKASHSDSRLFIRPYCQKSFKTYSVCKKHVGTHINEVIHMVKQLANGFIYSYKLIDFFLLFAAISAALFRTVRSFHWCGGARKFNNITTNVWNPNPITLGFGNNFLNVDSFQIIEFPVGLIF